MKITLALLPVFVVGCAHSAARPDNAATADVRPHPVAVPNIDLSIIDKSLSPCDDFFTYACHGWMTKTEIPADEASWTRSFSEIRDRNLALLRGYLDADAAGKGNPQDPYQDKLGNFWASCLDEEQINRTALTQLQTILSPIEGVKDAASLTKVLAQLHGEGIDALFDFGSGQDFKDATQVIGQLGQGGLGMPDRDFYLDQDPKKQALRETYLKHVGTMLGLAGEPAAQAATDAATVMRIETDLATASQTRAARRNPQNVYHRIDLAGVQKLAPTFQWTTWLTDLGHAQLKAISVDSPDFFNQVDKLLTQVPPADLRTYLRWHVIHSVADALSEPFVQENFRMQQAYTGQAQILPRWKRCLNTLNRTFGQPLAHPFIRETFGEDGKTRNLARVQAIEGAMKKQIAQVSWMDEPTRKKAQEKLALIANQIGYPDAWRDYSHLEMERGAYLTNLLHAKGFEVQRDLSKIGKPVDRNDWLMTPQEVNAYYEPLLNVMVFPAGILQPPFFNRASDEAANYGGIGMVMGHELTHGFDDNGRQFDGHGNLADWWTQSAKKSFEQRAACVEHQASDFVAIDDLHLNGKLTEGENLADLGGINLAYQAFEATKQGSHDIEGFTPEQQFFLAYGQAWCEKRRDAYERLMVTVNPHSPGRFRVNGPLSNLKAFREAFGCKEGDRMARPEKDRCEVW